MIQDTTTSIRNCRARCEITLVISTILVMLVVFLFLRNFTAPPWCPAVSVPLSLLGTFGVMYLLGFSLDNFSLMALIISTGFVVDNTIVVLENVTRHLERARPGCSGAQGRAGSGFTVLSMSISLVAVFFPILLMGGIVGRLFHEFAMTLTIAIFMSLIVSLTVTPMMCAYLDFAADEDENWLMRVVAPRLRSAAWISIAAPWPGRWTIPRPSCSILLVAVALNFYLFWPSCPRASSPIPTKAACSAASAATRASPSSRCRRNSMQFVDIIRADPAVA